MLWFHSAVSHNEDFFKDHQDNIKSYVKFTLV